MRKTISTLQINANGTSQKSMAWMNEWGDLHPPPLIETYHEGDATSFCSWWEKDERKDLVGWWCCKRSVRYGRQPVCNAAWNLRWRVWSLCVTLAEASEAVWGVHWKRMEDENAGSPRLWPAHAGLAEDRLYVSVQYHIEWSSSDQARRNKYRCIRSSRGIIQQVAAVNNL